MTDEVLIDIPSSPQPNTQPLGDLLLIARNAKKLTQKDVSNSLRLSVKQISALENNAFNELPEPMITRGFIRNYARLLEIDAEPLLASYRARTPEKTPNALSVQSSMHQVMSGKESQPWLKYILSSILVLLFLLAWLFYIDYMPKPVKPTMEKISESIATAPSTEIALPEIALPVAERQPDVAETVAGQEVVTVNDVAIASSFAKTTVPDGGVPSSAQLPKIQPTQTTPLPQNKIAETKLAETQVVGTKQNLPAPVVSPSVTSVVTSKSTAVDYNTLKANASKRLAIQDIKEPTVSSNTNLITTVPVKVSAKKVNMSFAEKTWVQVTDKSGKVIYEKTLMAGTSDGFDGQAPFNLVIGNAKATKLLFLGSPVDLAPSTNENNVARLVLQ